MGKARGGAGQKYDDVMGDGEAKDTNNEPETNMKEKFDDRYIIVYLRKNDSIGFVFFDISILHFYVGCFEDNRTNTAEFRTLV